MERMGTYVRMVALTIVIWDLYRTPESVRLALQTFVLGGLIPAVDTIRNYLTGVQSDFGRYSTSADGMNKIAFVLALTIPIALYLAFAPADNRLSRILRWLNLTCCFVALFAIILTATRFAIVMTIPAWSYAAFKLFGLGGWRRIAVVFAMICGLLVVVRYAPESSLDRLTTIQTEISRGDLTGRTAIWKKGLASVCRYPFLGLGAGAEGVPVIPLLGFPQAMHNSFLAVWVELGPVGILIMTTIVAMAVYLAWHMPKSSSWFWLMLLAVWGLGNLPISVFYTKETWLVLGLLVADSGNIEDRKQETENR